MMIMSLALVASVAAYMVASLRLGLSGAISIVCGVGALFLYNVWAGWL